MSPTGIVTQRERGHAFGTHPALDAGEYLAVEDGAQVVLLPVPAGVLHIGRSTAAGLTLDDATVSRRHAVIVRDRDGTRILDDRSLNGVVVRGVRVSDAELRDGDVIELGRVRLHYLRRAG
jgi:pSer/pThr/pTyr-binding forkhead associated (FHA) protein